MAAVAPSALRICSCDPPEVSLAIASSNRMLSGGVTPVSQMKGRPPASRLQSGVKVRILPVWWLSTRNSTTKSFGPSSLTV